MTDLNVAVAIRFAARSAADVCRQVAENSSIHFERRRVAQTLAKSIVELERRNRQTAPEPTDEQ